MLNVSFEIGGKKINPNNIGDALEKVVLEKIKEHVLNRVGNVRCPEHGTAPKIVCTGRDYQNITFKVSGCCDKLIEEVKIKLK